jgi:Ca-activated chloride channel family protein
VDALRESDGIRFGAVIGKGQGVLAVPLTYDIETITSFLEGLSSSSVTGRGTNLESLVSVSAGAFQDAFPTRRGIVLISDGESWSGSLAASLDRVIEGDITVIAVGVGAETGGPVPQTSSEAGAQPFSYRRTEILLNVAERTGGVYVDGNRKDAPDILADTLRGLSPSAGIKGYHWETQPRWRLFVMIGLISLGLSKSLEKRKAHRV